MNLDMVFIMIAILMFVNFFIKSEIVLPFCVAFMSGYGITIIDHTGEEWLLTWVLVAILVSMALRGIFGLYSLK